MMSSVVDVSRKFDREVAAVLMHKTNLLRVRNRLHSPLLRLPTETIVHILSFIMAELVYLNIRPWQSIYSTCHHIFRIMRNATELWWMVDCAFIKISHLMFVRSKRCPRVIHSDLRLVGAERILNIEKVLDHWKEKLGFRGHRLHTLELYVPPRSLPHFSWVLEKSLPCVERLTINIVDSMDDIGMSSWSTPVALELPMNMPLQTLDLRNVVLPWPSCSPLFNGLRKLSLSFTDCHPVVTIPEDELFGIFDASPQLECLSLLRVGHDVPFRYGVPLPPKRTLRFPKLTSLSLDNNPVVIKYTLEYMDLPAIQSLEIRSFISWEVAHSLIDLFFPNDHLPARLLMNPPTFVVSTADLNGPGIELDIGSVKLQLEFPPEQEAQCMDVVATNIPQLVPPSVTTLKAVLYEDFTEQQWRDFSMSHPEIRSIDTNGLGNKPGFGALWGALSPTRGDAHIPCPKLESISTIPPVDGTALSLTALSDCLRNRKAAGFKLKRLQMVDGRENLAYLEGFFDVFGPLAESAEAYESGCMRRWGTNYITAFLQFDEL